MARRRSKGKGKGKGKGKRASTSGRRRAAQSERIQATQRRQRDQRAARRSRARYDPATSSSSLSTAQVEALNAEEVQQQRAPPSDFLASIRRRGVRLFRAGEDEFEDDFLFDESIPQDDRIRRAVQRSNQRARRLLQILEGRRRVGPQPVTSSIDVLQSGGWIDERRRAVNWLRRNSRVESEESRSYQIQIPPNASFDLLANLAIRLTSVTSRPFLLEADGIIVTLSRANLSTFLAEASGRLSLRRGGFVGGSFVKIMGALLNKVGVVLTIILPQSNASGFRQSGGFWPWLLAFSDIWGEELMKELETCGLYRAPKIRMDNYKHNCLVYAISQSVYTDDRSPNEKADQFLFDYPEARAVIVSNCRSGQFAKSKVSELAHAIGKRCDDNGCVIKVTYICGGSGKRKVHVHGDTTKPHPLVIQIALLRGHWFCLRKLSITSFAVKMYWDIVGQPYRHNRNSQFTTRTFDSMLIDLDSDEDEEENAAVVDMDWKYTVQRTVTVTGESRWRTTSLGTRKCDSMTFLQLLLEHQKSRPTMIELDSLAFCFALAHRQERSLRDSETAVAKAAMIVRPAEFTPLLPGRDGAYERKVTETLLKQKFETRDEAKAYLKQRERGRYGRKSNGNGVTHRYVYDCETRGDAQIPFLGVLDTIKAADLEGTADPNRPFDLSESRIFYGDDCGQQMITYLHSKHGQDHVYVWMHNATYDIRQSLLGQLRDVQYRDIIFRGSSQSMISITIVYRGVTKITFRDTYCHLSCALSKTPKSFGLTNPDLGKEIMPYDMYDDLPEDGTSEYEKIRDGIKQELDTDFEGFEENARKWNCFFTQDGKQWIDLYDYASKYCQIDCALLARVFSIYRRTFYELTGQCAFQCLTVTSIGQRWLLDAGVYDGCYTLAAPQRRYVQQSVVGGRTSLCIDETGREKKSNTVACTPLVRRKIEDNTMDFEAKIQDCVARSDDVVCAIDMNSCYPFAWVTLSKRLGVPRGIPESHERMSLGDLKRYRFWVATLCVQKSTRTSSLPVMSYKDEQNTRRWQTPSSGTTFILNNIDAALWMEEGIVFKDECKWCLTWSDRVPFDSGEMIESLYEERKLVKKTARGNCIKLLLNSIYGRTIMKPPESSVEILTCTRTQLHKRLAKSYQTLIQCLKIGRCSVTQKGESVFTFFIKRACSEEAYQNLSHWGALILSESKRNMQMGLQFMERDGLCPGVRYTDTDSYMVTQQYVTKEFLQRFEGNKLGDLSNDLDPPQVAGKIIGETICIWSFFLAKKIYLMVNITPYEKEGKERIIISCKTRMKGIPEASVWAKAATYGKGLQGMIELYKDLERGTAVEFDLCAGGKPRLVVSQESQRFEKIHTFSRTIRIR